MHRLSASLPRLRVLAQAPRSNRASLAIQPSRSISTRTRPATTSCTACTTMSSAAQRRAYASATSSPKEAEGPSAESGGSRSKDAAEDAAAAANHGSGVDPETAGIDTLAERSAKGRTGGGQPLESSSHNAPSKPKITNASVPGNSGKDKLTDEQKREVDEHNRDFDKRHDRATPAAEDKVNKTFWSGGGTKESPGTK